MTNSNENTLLSRMPSDNDTRNDKLKELLKARQTKQAKSDAQKVEDYRMRIYKLRNAKKITKRQLDKINNIKSKLEIKDILSIPVKDILEGKK